MPTIVHFEIPADDIERARRFYVELFGWEIKKVPAMDYWFISTTGDRAIGGGMSKRASPERNIINYIDVPSVEDYSIMIESLGGKVKMRKQAVPGMGYFAVCLDPEGNSFGIWEDNKDAK